MSKEKKENLDSTIHEILHHTGVDQRKSFIGLVKGMVLKGMSENEIHFCLMPYFGSRRIDEYIRISNALIANEK